MSAKHIIFAGDSAGGNLSLALLQLLLTLQRMGVPSIKFHGKEVPVELPGGITTNSPWTDIARSLPSLHRNAHFDYIDPPTAVGTTLNEPIPDEFWPTKPPRAEIFCSGSILRHPLVSPLAATAELWKGMPPAWICLGNEGLEDEIVVLARRMHQGGGVVHLAGYEGMPHCFSMIFPTTPKGADCFQRQAKFITDIVSGAAPASSEAVWLEAFSNPPKAREVSFETISELTDAEISDAMAKMQEFAVTRENEALKKWTEQQSRAKL